jgi:site-specific DNA recombinase
MTSAHAYEEYDDYDDLELDAAPIPVAPIDPATRAVIYLRVSSAGQVNTDYDPEGISIPAQRVACRRKAADLGLTVVEEYVEPGRSATEMTKRVAMQQMLTRVRQDKDVGYVIVYKLSRLARNRYDDAIVMADLRKRGIALISATEAVDDSPVGQLMHGILATFNEYQSRESGADISYKMGQKAKNGGTLGRAPIGYRNVIERSEGREIRTVAIDPERAELVKLAFELYATGRYPLNNLADELYDRGLRTRATTRRPEGPLYASNLHQILQDRYYLGKVAYKGEEFDGRHPALIDHDLFDKVQDIVKSRANGDRNRIHDHYLKGSVFCGACRERGVTQRLAIQYNTNRHGNDYTYFFCRHKQTKDCQSPHMSTLRVEDAIEDYYATLSFSDQFIADVRDQIGKVVADEHSAAQLLKDQLAAELARLDVREGNLLDLAADGGMPTARIKHKLREITDQRDRITERLAKPKDELSYGIRVVETCLRLLERPRDLYRQCGEAQRRLLNQALFARIYVHHEHGIQADLRPPFDAMHAIHTTYRQGRDDAPPSGGLPSTDPRTDKKAASTTGDGLRLALDRLTGGIAYAQGCNNGLLVELRGFEPLTFSLRTRRATSCAIAPGCCRVTPTAQIPYTGRLPPSKSWTRRTPNRLLVDRPLVAGIFGVRNRRSVRRDRDAAEGTEDGCRQVDRPDGARGERLGDVCGPRDRDRVEQRPHDRDGGGQVHGLLVPGIVGVPKDGDGDRLLRVPGRPNPPSAGVQVGPHPDDGDPRDQDERGDEPGGHGEGPPRDASEPGQRPQNRGREEQHAQHDPPPNGRAGVREIERPEGGPPVQRRRDDHRRDLCDVQRDAAAHDGHGLRERFRLLDILDEPVVMTPQEKGYEIDEPRQCDGHENQSA